MIQTSLTMLWIAVLDRVHFEKLRTLLPVCFFVGVTSVAGSVGWFTAMTLQNPAYVKALGQGEFLVPLLITGRIFRGSIARIEGFGMFLIVASGSLLLLAP